MIYLSPLLPLVRGGGPPRSGGGGVCKIDLCRARCIFGWSVTGGRWLVMGDDNGDNYENFAGAIRNGADN